MAAAEAAAKPEKAYHFTVDLFHGAIPRWQELLGHLAGKPGLRYLEIGTYEGRSFLWVLDNILTHPTSHAVGVDIFFRDYKEVLMKNLEISGAADRATILEGPGEYVMKTLEDDSFDLIYLDGGHAARTVFAQAALAWQLLKEGGILIFDDYNWHDWWPLDQRPRLAVDAFLTIYSRELEVVNRAQRDVFVRKVASPCEPKNRYFCSNFTDEHYYDWGKQEMLSRGGGLVPLSEAEVALVERIMNRLELGETRAEPTAEDRADPAWASLVEKLGREP